MCIFLHISTYVNMAGGSFYLSSWTLLNNLAQKCIVLSVGIDQGRFLACRRKAMHFLFVYDVPPMVLHVPEKYPLNSNLLHLPCLALTLFSL